MESSLYIYYRLSGFLSAIAIVIPAKAGIQNLLKVLDPCLRRDDKKTCNMKNILFNICYLNLFFLTILTSLFLCPYVWAIDPQQKQPQTEKPQLEHIDKKSILTENNLFQISELLSDGSLIIEGLNGKWEFLDNRFKNMSKDKLDNAKAFLEGKFIKIPFPDINTGIVLPAELYDPQCFSNDDKAREEAGQCPVILSP